MRIRKLNKTSGKIKQHDMEKGPQPGRSGGDCLLQHIVHRVAPEHGSALQKYIILRVLKGKEARWQLWQWNDAEGRYIPLPDDALLLKYAQERADWLEPNAVATNVLLTDHIWCRYSDVNGARKHSAATMPWRSTIKLWSSKPACSTARKNSWTP